MTTRISNSEFLTIAPALPIDASGWEVRIISSHDWTTLIGYVRNWKKISGSKELNGYGAGSIELSTTNPILTAPFPAGLPGTIRQGEFLWQFWRDGVLRHEWISDDEKENEVSNTSQDNVITFAGRTLEKVLDWAVHRPVWAERQSYDVTGNPTGGTYRLKNPDTGEITAPIAWNASAASVHTALVAFSDIEPQDLEVRQGNWDGTPFTGRYNLLFKGGLTGIDYPRLEGNDVQLTGGAGEMKIDTAAYSSNSTWEDINSTTTGKPAASSILTFIQRAQDRGVLPFLDVTFSATADSAGVPWSDLTDVTVQPGETLLEMLQRLSDMLMWEFQVLSGFKLWVVQGSYGAHRESEVTFFKAGQQKKHDRSSSSRDVVTDIFVQSAKFEINHQSTTSPVTPWKREAFIEAGGSPSSASASLVGLATLELRKEKKVSRTVEVPAELKTRKFFVDYNVADWITLETSDGMEAVKVVGASFDCDPGGDEFGLEIVIQSAFDAREVKTQKMLEAMGSKAATGGQGSSPTGPAPVQRAVGIRDLTDVNVSGLRAGDVLVKGTSTWVPVAPTIDFLTDVNTVAVPPTNGQALVFDSVSGLWKPGTVSGGGETVPAGETVVDEFDDGSLAAEWVRVDGTGAVASTVTWTEARGALSALNTGGDSTSKLHALVRPVASSLAVGDGYVVRMRVLGRHAVNWSMGGLILSDGTVFGSGTQIVGLSYLGVAGGGLTNETWTATGFTAGTASGSPATTVPPGEAVVRLARITSTTWRCDVSPDGLFWILGVAATSSVVPTHVGFVSSSWGTAIRHVATYSYLRRVSGIV